MGPDDIIVENTIQLSKPIGSQNEFSRKESVKMGTCSTQTKIKKEKRTLPFSKHGWILRLLC